VTSVCVGGGGDTAAALLEALRCVILRAPRDTPCHTIGVADSVGHRAAWRASPSQARLVYI
jgi:hypothetical protein